MKYWSILNLLCFWSVMATNPAQAQLPDDRIVFVYSETSHCCSGIAPGSVFIVAAGSMKVGPATERIAPFPLVTTLGATTLKVISSGVTRGAYILSVDEHSIRAMLPSDTPLGPASVVVSYDGRESLPAPFEVVKRAFGLYNSELRPASYDRLPRGVQNVVSAFETPVNSFLDSARPGGLLMLWGSGLGAAPGDEAAGPIPGDLGISGLEVLVGVQPAKVLYAGRSGCCAGVDQILIEVPRGIEGCNVPVLVRTGEGDVVGYPVFASIASRTGACSDPHGLTESAVRAVTARSWNGAQISGGPNAWFLSFGTAAIAPLIPLGTCVNDADFSLLAFVVPSSRDAGKTMRIRTPKAVVEAQRTGDGTPSGFAGYWANARDLLDPGDYAIDNGEGGADIGPLRTSFTLPAQTLQWTNKAEITAVDSHEGVRVTWSGADPSAGFVAIAAAIAGESDFSSNIFCIERADKGEFTVPARFLRQASTVFERTDKHEPKFLRLWVGYQGSLPIGIPGFELGEFTYLRGESGIAGLK